MNFGIKINKAKKPFAFTLVELLVVIAVIAIVATLSILAFQSAREKSRDAKRIADIQQLRMALELYYNDASGYPPVSAFIAGEAISYVKNGNVKTYINKIPSAPVPADGDCTSQNNSYSYSSENPSTYTINYCLGNQSQEVPKGLNLATATQFYSLSCTDTTWTPDPATYCGDATQTSNCNATRTTAGTLSCSSPTPVCNN
ncbi:MAG: prepilin-type N-terminal cleavage/methylation domain-containing protein, partial [Planctomycetes bacterium]|nr:prepilin-type N-terminal cleavage/methylation domain-containing protein [Planctomycetota bacterium]